jgi:hypothetical protein
MADNISSIKACSCFDKPGTTFFHKAKGLKINPESKRPESKSLNMFFHPFLKICPLLSSLFDYLIYLQFKACETY